MKRTLALLPVLLAPCLASAQESLDAEHLQKAVRLITRSTADLKDLQLKLDLDTSKPVGVKGGGDVGLIAIPDKALTADALAKAGKELVPVGQLLTRGVVLAKDGKAVGGDKVRNVIVRDGEKETRVQLYLLGARRGEKKLELVVFAKDKEPLLTVPLETSESSQELPIELSGKGERDNEESAALILKFLGKFKSTIPVRPARD
jgi:hypothetical protein